MREKQGGKLPLEGELAPPANFLTRFPPPPFGSRILGKRKFDFAAVDTFILASLHSSVDGRGKGRIEPVKVG